MLQTIREKIKLYILKLVVMIFLSGCIPLDVNIRMPSYNRALLPKYNQKDSMVQAISIEAGISLSSSLALWEKYKNSGYEHFIDYLIEENPFEKVQSIYIEFMWKVKARTKLLKKMKQYA